MTTATWTETQARIVREASELKIAKVVVTVIAAPFWLVGFLLGLLWFVLALVWQAAWVGAGQAKSVLKRD